VRELEAREIAALKIVHGVVDPPLLAALGLRRMRVVESCVRLASLGIALEVIEAALGLTTEDVLIAVRRERRDLIRGLYSGRMRTREIARRLEVRPTDVSAATSDIATHPNRRGKRKPRNTAETPRSLVETPTHEYFGEGARTTGTTGAV